MLLETYFETDSSVTTRPLGSAASWVCPLRSLLKKMIQPHPLPLVFYYRSHFLISPSSSSSPFAHWPPSPFLLPAWLSLQPPPSRQLHIHVSSVLIYETHYWKGLGNRYSRLLKPHVAIACEQLTQISSQQSWPVKIPSPVFRFHPLFFFPTSRMWKTLMTASCGLWQNHFFYVSRSISCSVS